MELAKHGTYHEFTADCPVVPGYKSLGVVGVDSGHAYMSLVRFAIQDERLQVVVHNTSAGDYGAAPWVDVAYVADWAFADPLPS